MRKLALAVAPIALFVAPVAEAEHYRSGHTLYDVATNFSGAYIGGNAGYAWGDATLSNPSFMGVVTPGSASGDYEGSIAGGQIGYNAQIGHVVLGVEADFQGTWISESETYDVGGTPVTESSDLSWFSTVRGRLGLAFGAIMPYATAGFAFAKNELSVSTPGLSVSDGQVHAGWAFGGGLEYKEDYISLRAEYLYLDLGRETYSASALGATAGIDGQANFHILRSGLNYHF